MSPSFADDIVPAGLQNSANQTFTLPFIPVPPASLQLTLNGLMQNQGVDYTLVGNTITYVYVAPAPSDVQLAFFRYTGSTPPPRHHHHLLLLPPLFPPWVLPPAMTSVPYPAGFLIEHPLWVLCWLVSSLMIAGMSCKPYGNGVGVEVIAPLLPLACITPGRHPATPPLASLL